MPHLSHCSYWHPLHLLVLASQVLNEHILITKKQRHFDLLSATYEDIGAVSGRNETGMALYVEPAAVSDTAAGHGTGYVDVTTSQDETDTALYDNVTGDGTGYLNVQASQDDDSDIDL